MGTEVLSGQRGSREGEEEQEGSRGQVVQQGQEGREQWVGARVSLRGLGRRNSADTAHSLVPASPLHEHVPFGMSGDMRIM
jgi:hypothetical protein